MIDEIDQPALYKACLDILWSYSLILNYYDEHLVRIKDQELPDPAQHLHERRSSELTEAVAEIYPAVSLIAADQAIPRATDVLLGNGKWRAGAGVVVLTTPSPWVVGVLVQNVWAFAGDSERSAVNSMLIEYFINHNYPGGWHLSSAPIITANWEASSGNKWLVPFNVGFARVFAIGKQPVNCSAHYYHNIIHLDTAPYPAWTLRLQFQFLFPK